MKATLIRINSDQAQTTGLLVITDKDNKVFECNTIELPWRNNAIQLSCIPVGSYLVIKHNSPRFKKCFWVTDVPGRTNILIHAGNFNRDTLGCILPGVGFTDIDNDGNKDVVSSKATLNNLLTILPDEFILTIV